MTKTGFVLSVHALNRRSIGTKLKCAGSLLAWASPSLLPLLASVCVCICLSAHVSVRVRACVGGCACVFVCVRAGVRVNAQLCMCVCARIIFIQNRTCNLIDLPSPAVQSYPELGHILQSCRDSPRPPPLIYAMSSCLCVQSGSQLCPCADMCRRPVCECCLCVKDGLCLANAKVFAPTGNQSINHRMSQNHSEVLPPERYVMLPRARADKGSGLREWLPRLAACTCCSRSLAAKCSIPLLCRGGTCGVPWFSV